MSKKIHEGGKIYGRLRVLAEADTLPKKKGTHVRWLCVCVCGRRVVVPGYKLRQGQWSCGCYRNQKTAARMTAINKRKAERKADRKERN